MQCARHPKVETGLSCSRCGTPICPACCISGPVGMRCRECASLRSSTLYKIHPGRLALGGVVGLGAGTVAGALLDFGLGFFFFYILLFVGPWLGRIVSDIILKVVGQKRGLPLEIVAGVSVVGGAVIAQLISGDWDELFYSPTRGIVYAAAVGLTAWFAVARIHNQ